MLHILPKYNLSVIKPVLVIMCFSVYDFFCDTVIDSLMSTSRTTCSSSCLAISAANLVPSNVKPSSLQVIVSPSIPALESTPIITAAVVSSVLGGLLILIFLLVAVTVFIVLRAKWQKKKMIDVLEQDFRRR